MVKIDADKFLAETQQLKEAEQKAEQELIKANEGNMKLIQFICQQSPWRHLQFDHSSSSPIKPPTMNKVLRNALRELCARICQITGNKDSALLKIAHIVPKKTAVQTLADRKIEHSCNSAKNRLLLVGTLEASFNHGDFCLLLKPVPETAVEGLAVKILNGSIKEDTIPGIPGCELKFKDLDNKFLLDVCLNVASYRCIAQHSHYALAAATSKGWIQLSEYLDLSAKIKDHSPEQDKVARVQEWLRHGQLSELTSRAHSSAPLTVTPRVPI